MFLSIEDTNLFQVKMKIARREGLLEGKLEGKLETAQEMFNNNVPLELISKYVKLTEEELKHVLKK